MYNYEAMILCHSPIRTPNLSHFDTHCNGLVHQKTARSIHVYKYINQSLTSVTYPPFSFPCILQINGHQIHTCGEGIVLLLLLLLSPIHCHWEASHVGGV